MNGSAAPRRRLRKRPTGRSYSYYRQHRKIAAFPYRKERPNQAKEGDFRLRGRNMRRSGSPEKDSNPVRSAGKFYMVYSADEHIAVAMSDSPTGPFKKYSGNPILHGFDDIAGTGHHSFAPTGDSNKYICIYHCHSGDNESFTPRKICLAEAEFVQNPEGGNDIPVINQ